MGAQNEGLTRKLTAEEEAAAERIYAAVKEKVEEQVRGMARLMASKKSSELLGRTEFELRDMVLELGANVLQTAVNERAKKRGPKNQLASPAAAATVPNSSLGAANTM